MSDVTHIEDDGDLILFHQEDPDSWLQTDTYIQLREAR